MKPSTVLIRVMITLPVLAVLALTSCDFGDGVDFSKAGPDESFVALDVANASLAEFSVIPKFNIDKPGFVPSPIAVSSSYRQTFPPQSVQLHESLENASSHRFQIQRQGTSRAQVSYRVLRFPTHEGMIQNVTIVITETSPGIFGTTTPDSTWIQVLGVESLV